MKPTKQNLRSNEQQAADALLLLFQPDQKEMAAEVVKQFQYEISLMNPLEAVSFVTRVMTLLWQVSTAGTAYSKTSGNKSLSRIITKKIKYTEESEIPEELLRLRRFENR